MKAEEYLQLKTAEIKENLKENLTMNLDEKGVANYIKKIINELTPNRLSPKVTKDILNKYFGEPNNSICIIPHYEGRLIESWLLKVLNVDDTYQFASNYLQQRDNRITGILVALKDKSTIELINLINEKEIINPSVTMKSICSKSELNEIRKILIKDKIISKINEADFLHHFTGQPMDENINKIEFLCIGKNGNPNKDRLYTLISELIQKKSLVPYFDKINYSIRDNNNNMIKLAKNNNRFSLISNDFKKFCDQAKKRVNT